MTRYSNDVKRLLERRGAQKARDGAIIDPVVDEANGIQWFFKYRKNSLSKYKWFYMGGTDLCAADQSAFIPGSAGVYLSAGPSIQVPFSGMYMPRAGAAMINGSVAGTSMAVGVGIDTGVAPVVSGGGNGAGTSYVLRVFFEMNLPQGSEIQSQHSFNMIYYAQVLTGAPQFQDRVLFVRPKNVML